MLKRLGLEISDGIKNTAFYATGVAFSKVIAFFVLPIVTRYIPPHEYGRLEFMLVFINLLGIFLGRGLVEALMSCVTHKDWQERKKFYYGNALSYALLFNGLLITTLLFLAPTILHKLPVKIKMWEYCCAIYIVSITNLTFIQMCWLRIENKLKLFLASMMLLASIQATWSISGLMLGFQVGAILTSSAFVHSFIFLLLSCHPQTRCAPKINLDIFKEMTRFGLPLVLSAFASFCIMGLDELWVGAAIGTEQLAYYSIAKKVIFLAAFLFEPYMLWWGPKKFQLLQETDHKEAYARLISIGIIVFLLVINFIILAGTLFIWIMLPGQYEASLEFIPYISFIVSLRVIGDLLATGSIVVRSTWVVMMANACSAVLAISVYQYTSQENSVLHLVQGLLAIYCLRALFIYAVSQHIFKIPYQKIKLAAVSTIFITFTVSGFLLHSIMVIVATLLSSILIAISAYYLALIPPMHHFIRRK